MACVVIILNSLQCKLCWMVLVFFTSFFDAIGVGTVSCIDIPSNFVYVKFLEMVFLYPMVQQYLPEIILAMLVGVNVSYLF